MKHFSKKEDNIIISAVQNSPTNLTQAFRNASLSLPGRSVEGISFRWYNYIKKKRGVFSLGSNNNQVINTKNSIDRKSSIEVSQGKICLGNGIVIEGNFTIKL